MLNTNSIYIPSSGAGGQLPQSARAGQQLDQNYTDFLRLLTTQLRHQDPTDPTDTNQLTQQIATLSQVEQQINTNKNLERMISLLNTTQYNSVVSYIGKQIEAAGNQGALQNGEAPFVYYLAADAETVDVTIKDATGNVVYTGPAPAKTEGRNEFVWDGKNNEGEDMPDGIYSITVEAKDASQNAVTAQVYTTGIVTSIDSVNGVVYASIGDHLAVPLSSILSVRTPSEPNSQPDSAPDSAPDSIPDSAPDSVPDSAPDSVPDSAPDSTPDSTPDSP